MPIPGPPITSGSTVQFVDSIAASPTVRLDLNDGISFITLREGTSFNPPPLNQPTSAIAGLFDGAPPSASSYGNRVVELKLRLKAADEDGLANLIRSLMVELNRNTNILKLQVTSTPVFFRTYRTSAEDIDFGDLGLGECTVTVPILAESCGYGLRVDQAGVSVKANPALTNGCYLDVNGVTGDVATPAYVALSSGTVGGLQSATYLASRGHGAPASLQFVYQAESATVGIDTTVTAVTDAQASGAGNNYAITTFAGTAAMATRVTFAIAAAELRGTYRLLARVKQSSGTGVFKFEVSLGDLFGSVVVTSQVPGPTITSGWRTFDLGLVQLPPGQDSNRGYDGVYPGTSGGNLNLRAQRVSGSGTLSWDYLLLVPADEALTIFQGTSAWNGSNSVILDGPNDAAYRALSGQFDFSSSGWSASRAGNIPLLQPGSNRLFFVENISTQVVGDSSTVAVSWWPRYLVV